MKVGRPPSQSTEGHSIEDWARYGGGLEAFASPNVRFRMGLPEASVARDTPGMSCRHKLDAPSDGPFRQAPSACRKWRRWPSELPGPANDNGGQAVAWALRAAGGASIGLVGVLGLLLALAY